MTINQLDKHLQESQIKLADLANDPQSYGICPGSVQKTEAGCLFMSSGADQHLYVMGKGKLFDAFEGDQLSSEVKKCPLSAANAKTLRRYFPFTAPTASPSRGISIGLGDRLGNATPGHIRSVKSKPVFPILAQQSIRELNFTDRTYEDVLDAASWAVFQEGYTTGFGADGDHLKTTSEIKMALDYGFTMITLDCSDHINNDIPDQHADQVCEAYGRLPESLRRSYEKKYLRQPVKLKSGQSFTYSEDELKRLALIYGDAISFTVDIYNSLLKPCDHKLIFEMSIDETQTPTSPNAHYFVASELIDQGVVLDHLAPRFCGEFQKGIDYIGSADQFEAELIIHTAIADELGYKISVHSGSDKFTLFPIIGRITKGSFHLKTAGTSWLEAIRLIATKDPDLYREIHRFAIESLPEAMKHYSINGRPENVADLDTLSDAELPGLMDLDDARQIIHINYGQILQASDEQGQDRFKSRMYKVWQENEQAYAISLSKHIDKHIETLGL